MGVFQLIEKEEIIDLYYLHFEISSELLMTLSIKHQYLLKRQTTYKMPSKPQIRSSFNLLQLIITTNL